MIWIKHDHTPGMQPSWRKHGWSNPNLSSHNKKFDQCRDCGHLRLCPFQVVDRQVCCMCAHLYANLHFSKSALLQICTSANPHFRKSARPQIYMQQLDTLDTYCNNNPWLIKCFWLDPTIYQSQFTNLFSLKNYRWYSTAVLYYLW